jgi:hypothetical protein
MIWVLLVVMIISLWLLASRQRWASKRELLLRAGRSLDDEVARRRQLLPALEALQEASGAESTPQLEHDLSVSEERIGAAWRWYVSAFGSYQRSVTGIWVSLFARKARSGLLTSLAPEPNSGPILLGLGHAQCPNCGAPLQLDAHDRCPYCRVELLRVLGREGGHGNWNPGGDEGSPAELRT